MYGVQEIIESSACFHVVSRTFIRVRIDVSEWLVVNVLLRQSCVIYPWLFKGTVLAVIRFLSFFLMAIKTFYGVGNNV